MVFITLAAKNGLVRTLTIPIETIIGLQSEIDRDARGGPRHNL